MYYQNTDPEKMRIELREVFRVCGDGGGSYGRQRVQEPHVVRVRLVDSEPLLESMPAPAG